ncbi:hypothetical protein AB0J09_65025, partial [Nonomuraea sp. NPDC049784]
MSDARVTVVVASKDRLRALTRTLPLHPRPVILVDNDSTDGTPGFVRRHFPDVHLVEAGTNLGALRPGHRPSAVDDEPRQDHRSPAHLKRAREVT